MWEGMKSQNWTEFENSLSDRFMAICPAGFQSKAQSLADMKKGKLNSYNLGDWHAIKISDSAGIVMYRAELDGTSPTGKPHKGTCYCSSTWSKKGGKWICDSHQTTMQDETMEK
jgi:hypothetical protein